MKTTLMRKTVLSVAGVAFAGGLVAGPVTGAMAADTHAVKPVAAAAVVSADKPGPEKLSPHGVQGAQSRIDLSDEQKANAKAIVAATKANGLNERAAVISIATALQESKLQNLGNLGAANDHDSLGLFQQRPTSGWGSPEQITNPQYATTAFQKALQQVPGWQDMTLTDAAQKVQVSAYPDAYAKWESQAADLTAQYWNS
jgi:hypothetical protein